MRLSHVQAHIEQQFILSKFITKAYDSFVGDGLSDVTTNRVKSCLSTLKDDWERFCLEHKAILVAMHELNDDDRLVIQSHALEKQLGSSKEPPTWQQFSEFLISQLLTFQAFENSRSGLLPLQPNSKAVKSHYQGKSTENKYTSKSVPQKVALINKHKLCFNCLGTHRVSACQITKRSHILRKLTTSIPSTQINKPLWPHLKGLQLADPNFLSSQSIDLILGADIYGHIIENKVIKGPPHSPTAQFTKLGWIVSGPTDTNVSSNTSHSYHVSVDDELYRLLHRFWEIDEIPSVNTSSLSSADQECENHFVSTHSRDAHGRYIVKLPFKRSPDQLGNSRNKAVRLSTNLSNKFSTNSVYAQLYSKFMSEYESLEHMQIVPESQPEPQPVYYLPHHGVMREHSLTTKLRVVFNGSSRTTSGVSLNDLLHTGAKLQTNLFDVLVWFRKFHCVFVSDMEKMYRQIKSNCLRTYELTTVTYGLACAPFLALRTLLQLIEDEGQNFPRAIPSLTKGRYVDDVFGGADSIDEVQPIITQLNQLCMAGGFTLRKWISNYPSILKDIPTEHQTNLTSLEFKDSTVFNALGLCWQPAIDAFQFTLKLPSTKHITKRCILSTISTLFDPLGLLSPITIKAKILIQELWAIKLDWDDHLSMMVTNKWTTFLNTLQEMTHLTFPRWLGCKSTDKIEIHGFCDASQQAAAAAVYLRSTDSNGIISINLVASKTKVAPLKKLTIPRLELSGAVLLAKLSSHILKVLEIGNIPIYLWTDSAITYTWINNHPSRWKEFVHNQVCYIQETLPSARWKFVPGNENPADLATRGLTPIQLRM
ncbi:uncharacterized protein LOC118646918 [Monomorium pharaonis]|uniref:uncharacterized protein LOC118646918 n=1 Tax=Monomorium pharaonis TaxID=307658 RepID=UPI001746330C|nr:uncharacterized protein LOC118646918 [Monomorium pharaonis]